MRDEGRKLFYAEVPRGVKAPSRMAVTCDEVGTDKPLRLWWSLWKRSERRRKIGRAKAVRSLNYLMLSGSSLTKIATHPRQAKWSHRAADDRVRYFDLTSYRISLRPRKLSGQMGVRRHAGRVAIANSHLLGE